MAVPTVLLVLVIGLGFSTVAILASTSSQRGSVRDQDRKEGIAAADAGVDQAILRQNKVPTSDSTPCLNVSGPGLLVPGTALADGWCAPISGQVAGASYVYRASPRIVIPSGSSPTGQELFQMHLASTGTSGEVGRRVLVRANAPTGNDVFGFDRSIGREEFRIGGEALVNTSAGSDGDIVIENNGTLCGDARHGVEQAIVFNNQGTQCGGYGVSEGDVELPPPNLTRVRAINSNWRFFGFDTATGSPVWDPVTKTLTLDGSDTVTLGGNDYLLCRLDMSGSSRLIMAAGATANLYIESPENCGMSDPAEQIKAIGTSAIISTAYDPDNGRFDLLGIYMLGSDNVTSTAIFNGTANVGNEFVLYAPRTDVEIGGTAEYHGAIAGKTLLVDGTALLTSTATPPNPDIATIILYKRDRYVECTGVNVTPPNAGC